MIQRHRLYGDSRHLPRCELPWGTGEFAGPSAHWRVRPSLAWERKEPERARHCVLNQLAVLRRPFPSNFSLPTLPFRLFPSDFSLPTFPFRFFPSDFSLPTLPFRLFPSDLILPTFPFRPFPFRLFPPDFSLPTFPDTSLIPSSPFWNLIPSSPF